MRVCRTAERGPHRSAKEQFTPRRSSVTNVFVPTAARVGRTSSTQFLASYIEHDISSIRWQLFSWHGVRIDFQRPYEDHPDRPQKWIRTGHQMAHLLLNLLRPLKTFHVVSLKAPEGGLQHHLCDTSQYQPYLRRVTRRKKHRTRARSIVGALDRRWPLNKFDVRQRQVCVTTACMRHHFLANPGRPLL